MSVMRNVYRELTEAEKAAMAEIKTLGDELHAKISAVSPDGWVSREISLAKTKLEEAVMWAVKGLTG